MTNWPYINILRVLLVFAALAVTGGKSAWGQSVPTDWGFIKFLIDRENYTQALSVLDRSTNLSVSGADSTEFYRGWALYNLKQLPSSTDAFRKVSATSPFYTRSGLFGSWNLAYQKDLSGAGLWLNGISGTSLDENTLVKFETLGLYLLQRDLDRFKTLRPSVSATHYAWGEALGKMDTFADQLVAYRPKKVAIAGLLSSVVPGLGKIYTGQTGSGISAFLLCGALGAMTIENGIKTGWGNWSTLLFGGLFTLFYAGNIYGSLISAKEVRDYYNEDMDQRILLDMHLPLREFYR